VDRALRILMNRSAAYPRFRVRIGCPVPRRAKAKNRHIPRAAVRYSFEFLTFNPVSQERLTSSAQYRQAFTVAFVSPPVAPARTTPFKRRHRASC